MKYIYTKSLKINSIIIKEELDRRFYKSIFVNTKLPFRLRHNAFFCIAKKKKYGSISLFRSRCYFTYKSRAVLNFFKQSRIQFRYFVSSGQLPGIRKASW